MPTKHDDDEMVYTSATLKGALDRMTLKGRRAAFELFEHLEARCEELDKAADPLSLAYSVHEEVDERMALMLATSPHAKDVKCRKGCAACCCNYVGVFPHEARLLRGAAVEAGFVIDEERLARQAQKTELTWPELAIEDRRCVFLGEDRTCQVYEHRPSGCRKYLVKNDPELCDSEKYPGGEVSVVFSLDAEVLHSAAMTVFGRGSDNMAAVLLGVALFDNYCEMADDMSKPKEDKP